MQAGSFPKIAGLYEAPISLWLRSQIPEEMMSIVKNRTDGDGILTITLAEYLREHFVKRSITFKIEKGALRSIYFVSNEFGTVDWEEEVGLLPPHQWESEDEARKSSPLSRHYTTLLQDGILSTPEGKDAILESILRDTPASFVELLNEILKRKHWNGIERLNRTILESFSASQND